MKSSVLPPNIMILFHDEETENKNTHSWQVPKQENVTKIVKKKVAERNENLHNHTWLSSPKCGQIQQKMEATATDLSRSLTAIASMTEVKIYWPEILIIWQVVTLWTRARPNAIWNINVRQEARRQFPNFNETMVDVKALRRNKRTKFYTADAVPLNYVQNSLISQECNTIWWVALICCHQMATHVCSACHKKFKPRTLGR